MIRKIRSVLACLLLAMSLAASAAAPATPSPRAGDIPPQILGKDRQGNVVIPFEFSSEYLGVGVDYFNNGLMCAERNGKYGIIDKSGSWYSYGGSKLGQGADACKALLKDNPELLDELEAKVREALAAKDQK